MKHLICRVQSFEHLEGYTLKIHFSDNSQQVINFEPVLFGDLYGPLRDLTLFNQVKVDPEVYTLVWPNGADFDPATLHDWPQYAPDFTTRAQQWGRTAA